MENNTVTSFTMTAYAVMENYKYVQFTIFLLLYIMIIFLNGLLIYVIYQHEELRQPMNLFTCNLAINEIYGGTALLPTTMSLLTSMTHEMSLKGCLTQIYSLHTYACIEFCILAVMGYDRYVAICHPLHYHTIMSVSRVCKLVALAWLYPCLIFLFYFTLTLKLKFCSRFIHKLHCVNFELVKNACSNTSHISTLGLITLLFLMAPQVVMVIFSYVHILRVCKKLSKDSQVKALKTCVPHLLSIMNYTIGALCEVIQSRFEMNHAPVEVMIMLSIYFIIIPAVTNPVLYGIGTKAIRDKIFNLFFRKTRRVPT